MSYSPEKPDAPDALRLGRRIRRHRIEAGLDQIELGRRMGVGQQSVSRWERGIGGIKWITVRRLEVEFGLEAGELSSF